MKINSTQYMLCQKPGATAPRHWKLFEGAERLGLMDKWAYRDQVEELLLRFKTTSNSAWRNFYLERRLLCRQKTAVVRRLLELSPGCLNPVEHSVVKITGYTTKTNVSELFTELRFSLGAHGIQVVKWPIPGIQKEYAVVKVTDQVEADHYLHVTLSERNRQASQAAINAIQNGFKASTNFGVYVSLFSDTAPFKNILTDEEYAKALNASPPRLLGSPEPRTTRKTSPAVDSEIERLVQELEALKKMVGSK